METKTKEDAGRLLVSVLTIVTTVIAGNFGVDYRQAERAAIVHEEVAGVASQNQEILEGIARILDQKLLATKESGERNTELNRQILDSAAKRMELHHSELKLLSEIKTEVDKLKDRTK